MKIEEPCNINAPAGATPMTIADAVIRECGEIEWIKDVMFYLKCYLSRNYPETIDALYTKIYAYAEPAEIADKLYEIFNGDEIHELAEILKEYKEGEE